MARLLTRGLSGRVLSMLSRQMLPCKSQLLNEIHCGLKVCKILRTTPCLRPQRLPHGTTASGHRLAGALVAGIGTAGVIRLGSGEPGGEIRIGPTVLIHGVPPGIRGLPVRHGATAPHSPTPVLRGAEMEITAPTTAEVEVQTNLPSPRPGRVQALDQAAQKDLPRRLLPDRALSLQAPLVAMRAEARA